MTARLREVAGRWVVEVDEQRLNGLHNGVPIYGRQVLWYELIQIPERELADALAGRELRQVGPGWWQTDHPVVRGVRTRRKPLVNPTGSV